MARHSPNESKLSELLGESRPVLREALRALQIQGLLDIRRGNQGGTFVTDLDNLSFQNNLEKTWLGTTKF